MVGFNPSDHVHLSQREAMIAGAVSGALTRLFCQPFDVLKIRFQLQIEPVQKTSTQSKYRGILQAVKTIGKEERIWALWKGHVPAQYLSIVFGAAQFATFEVLTKSVWDYLPDVLTTDLKPLTHTACGGLAGCVAIVVAHPFDVVRTRLVGQGEPKVYKSFSRAMVEMPRTEGVRSFYKGLVPAVMAAAPQAALQFGFYAALTSLLGSHGIISAGLCGTLAGMGAKTIIYPMDVAKKRLQIQGFEEARKPFGQTRQYNNFYICLKRIYLEEGGLRGIYKGLSPGMLKAGVSTGLSFLFYDMCSRTYKQMKDMKES